MNQVKWEDLRPAYQQTLLHVHRHGTLPEDTPECYEVASSLIANYQFMKLVPASLTVHPGEEYCLTAAGKELMSTRDEVTEDSNSGDPLTEALLEGDYAGIRKLFEELKAERDAANKRRGEVDAEAAVLRSALEHYTEAEVVTDWGNQETQDDGAIPALASRLPRRPSRSSVNSSRPSVRPRVLHRHPYSRRVITTPPASTAPTIPARPIPATPPPSPASGITWSTSAAGRNEYCVSRWDFLPSKPVKTASPISVRRSPNP